LWVTLEKGPRIEKCCRLSISGERIWENWFEEMRKRKWILSLSAEESVSVDPILRGKSLKVASGMNKRGETSGDAREQERLKNFNTRSRGV